jgi:hypothetical protein
VCVFFFFLLFSLFLGEKQQSLKPENVMLKRTADGGFSAKVADFGVSKFLLHEDVAAGNNNNTNNNNNDNNNSTRRSGVLNAPEKSESGSESSERGSEHEREGETGELLLDDGGGLFLGNHTVSGTPGWWAPELASHFRQLSCEKSKRKSRPRLDPFAADMFSFGLVLFALASASMEPFRFARRRGIVSGLDHRAPFDYLSTVRSKRERLHALGPESWEFLVHLYEQVSPEGPKFRRSARTAHDMLRDHLGPSISASHRMCLGVSTAEQQQQASASSSSSSPPSSSSSSSPRASSGGLAASHHRDHHRPPLLNSVPKNSGKHNALRVSAVDIVRQRSETSGVHASQLLYANSDLLRGRKYVIVSAGRDTHTRVLGHSARARDGTFVSAMRREKAEKRSDDFFARWEFIDCPMEPGSCYVVSERAKFLDTWNPRRNTNRVMLWNKRRDGVPFTHAVWRCTKTGCGDTMCVHPNGVVLDNVSPAARNIRYRIAENPHRPGFFFIYSPRWERFVSLTAEGKVEMVELQSHAMRVVGELDLDAPTGAVSNTSKGAKSQEGAEEYLSSSQAVAACLWKLELQPICMQAPLGSDRSTKFQECANWFAESGLSDVLDVVPTLRQFDLPTVKRRTRADLERICAGETECVGRILRALGKE